MLSYVLGMNEEVSVGIVKIYDKCCQRYVLEGVRQYCDEKWKRKFALILLFSMEMVEENEMVARGGESGRRREKEPRRSHGKISKVIYYNFFV